MLISPSGMETQFVIRTKAKSCKITSAAICRFQSKKHIFFFFSFFILEKFIFARFNEIIRYFAHVCKFNAFFCFDNCMTLHAYHIEQEEDVDN